MTTIDTEIKYDRLTKDFSCFVDGRYVGSRPSYSAGEQLCNQVASDLISDGLVYSASELDPPAPEPPIVIVEAPDPTPPESRCATCGGEGDCPDCDGGGATIDAMAHPRYTRAAAFDKRFERGDPYDGDAWRDEFSLLRWVAVGSDPNL